MKDFVESYQQSKQPKVQQMTVGTFPKLCAYSESSGDLEVVKIEVLEGTKRTFCQSVYQNEKWESKSCEMMEEFFTAIENHEKTATSIAINGLLLVEPTEGFKVTLNHFNICEEKETNDEGYKIIKKFTNWRKRSVLVTENSPTM